MKTPKVLTDVEHQAARQLGLVMSAVKKQYQRLVTPSRKKRPHSAERQYLKAVEDTIVSAEQIIRKLKPRIAAAKRSLGVTKKTVKKKVKRAATKTRRAVSATKRAARKKKL